MVKNRRRQIALLVALLVLGGALLYWLYGSGSGLLPAASRTAAGRGGAPVDLAEVPRIGLERLKQLAADSAADSAGGSAIGEGLDTGEDAGTRSASAPAVAPAAAAPATPAEPTPQPMNMRFIGAVEVRSGVWVASLLNDRKDLLTGKEGDVIANRYRIVKIGITSIELLETATGQQHRVKLGGS